MKFIFKSGYLYVILAALLWAVSGSAAKFLFNGGITAFQLVQLRITLSAAVLFVFFLIKDRTVFRIEKKDIFYFFILGAGAMAGVQFTYLFAISRINVAAAILLQYMAPSFIALYTIVLGREKLTLRIFTALFLSMAGCYFVVGGYRLDFLSMDRLGVLSGLLSAVVFAWYSLQGEYGMHKYRPITVLFYAFFFAVIPWNALYPPFKAFGLSLSAIQWVWIFYIVIFGTLMPFGLYFKGVSIIRSTRASITAILEPITAGIISYVFLGEIMDIIQMAGGILVIASIILISLDKVSDNGSPEILRITKTKESCG